MGIILREFTARLLTCLVQVAELGSLPLERNSVDDTYIYDYI